MIDTHCHLDVARFEGDRAQVLERAWAAGVTALVIPAIGPDAWAGLLEWPGREPRVQVALGLHPQRLPDLPAADDERHLARLDELLGTGVACAVGECGLDGASAPGAPMERQLAVFRAHLGLARKHRLPVLVHCLLLHSYSGSAELSGRYMRHGCHFSFAGPVTFTEARRPMDALRSVPLDRLMAETDAPDQAPHPHRGRRSEPGFLPLIVEGMARARAEQPHLVRAATTENARRFFGLRALGV